MAKKKESNIISTAADLGSSDILSMISSFDDKSEILDEAKASKIKEYIGTGSFILNAAMTGSIYGGIPSGRVVSFAGEAGVGKTFLAVSACREAQKKGWTPIYLDSENSIDPSFIERLGCDPKNFIIRQVSTVKEVTTFISNLCKTFDDKGVDFPKVVIVLDSIGNLTSDKEFNDSIEGKSARDMTRAQEVKAMFRIITTSLGRLSIPMIVTNHVYANLGSFFGGVEQSSGSGIKFSSSITMLLTAAKLEDKANDKAASEKKGEVVKNGVLVTAKPIKSRFCIPQKVRFQIPYFCKPNPYVGLEQYMTWDNSGICRGNLLEEKEYLKLSESERGKCHVIKRNNMKKYAYPKDSARTIVCSHLGDCGEAVPLIEFFSSKVFTPEFLDMLNDEVIKPAFELPSQNSFKDIEELEESLGIQTAERSDKSDKAIDVEEKEEFLPGLNK